MLRIQSISKAFPGKQLFTNSAIDLDRGRITGLVGRSASGKTVLCKCIVGLETADNGTVELEGRTLNASLSVDHPQWTGLRRSVAYVPQASMLPGYRTVRSILLEGPKFILGLSLTEAEQRAQRSATLAQLDCDWDRYPGNLSGGQLARLSLARALTMGPDYLLCDEPTSNLDPLTAAEILKSLEHLRDLGVGILVVTHQLSFLRRLADRVHFLDGGVLHGPMSKDEFFVPAVNAPQKRFVEALAG